MKTRRVADWILAVSLLSSIGCATAPPVHTYRTQLISVPEQPAELEYQGLPLRSGQVIVSDGNSPRSLLLELMAAEFAPFGHAGIIVIEGGEAWVYDGYAHLDLRFWEPPTARLNGRIRRIPLADILAGNSVVAIYEHTSLDLAPVAAFAKAAHTKKTPFDGFFDFRTKEALYCTEFVARALESANHPEVRVTPRTDNASLLRAMRWLELDTPGFILPSAVIERAQRVALLSPTLTEPEIETRIAVRAELHRRFAATQKLGDLFRWSVLGPRYRAPVEAFSEQMMALAATNEDAAWEVTKHANSFFDAPKPVARLMPSYRAEP